MFQPHHPPYSPHGTFNGLINDPPPTSALVSATGQPRPYGVQPTMQREAHPPPYAFRLGEGMPLQHTLPAGQLQAVHQQQQQQQKPLYGSQPLVSYGAPLPGSTGAHGGGEHHAWNPAD